MKNYIKILIIMLVSCVETISSVLGYNFGIATSTINEDNSQNVNTQQMVRNGNVVGKTWTGKGLKNVNYSLFKQIGNDYNFWKNVDCAEIKTGEVYDGEIGIYLDRIVNNNTYPIYVKKVNTAVSGQYITFNLTQNNNNAGIFLLSNQIKQTNGEVKGKETIQHVDTAEKIGGNSYFSEGYWTGKNGFTVFGSPYKYANYAIHGHPTAPTYFPNFDGEFRTITFFSKNKTTDDDSKIYAIVECQRMVVRRCGDGIYEPSREQCDEGSNNGKPGSHCTADCTTKEVPLCGNGQLDPGEECDPAYQDLYSKNVCTNECKLKNACSSAYNNTTTSEDLSQYQGKPSKLCGGNAYTATDIVKDEVNHKWTWKCEYIVSPRNGTTKTVGSASCSATYTVQTPTCNSEYTSKNDLYETDDLAKEGNKLCTNGVLNTNHAEKEKIIHATSYHKRWWWCGTTETSSFPQFCEVSYKYCGDGQVTNGEACDPNDSSKKGRGNGGCDSSCKPTTEEKPKCGTDASLTPVWTEKPGQRVTKNSKYLCEIGTLSNNTVSYNNGTYNWSCTKNGYNDICLAYDARCGDGIRQSDYEECDPNDSSKKGRGNGGCSTTCEPIKNQDPYCGSEHNNPKYNTNFPTARLNKDSKNLCVNGDVSDLNFDSTKGTYVWECNGKSGTTPAQCNTKDLRCGDGIKNGNEQCDPNDPNHEGRGNGICNASCQVENAGYEIHKSLKSATWDGSKWIVVWTITGSSKNQASNMITLVDTFPAGYTYISNSANYSYSNGKITVPANQAFNFDITTSTTEIKQNDTAKNKICVEGKDICDEEIVPSLEIKKTPITTKVSAMGQEVDWKIEVTTHNQPITNFEIKDTLPEALTYESVSISPSNLNITKEGDKNLTFKVKGTLAKESTATITVKTKVNQSFSEIKNVACLEGTVLCDTGSLTGDFQPSLWIKKVFLVDGNEQKELTGLHKGAEVQYKITFGNTGDKIATVKFEDIKPANLGDRTITSATRQDGSSVDLNSEITLKKDDVITVLAEGKVTKYHYQDAKDRTNTAKITDTTTNKTYESSVTYDVDMKPYFWIKKVIVKDGQEYDGEDAKNLDFEGGDSITFKVTFGNDGEVDAEKVRFLDDTQWLRYLKSESIKGTLTVNGETKNGTDISNLTLYEGTEGTFILEGVFVEDNADGTKSALREASSNQACVGFSDKWNNGLSPERKQCDTVGFKPHFPSIQITKTVDKKEVYSGDIVTFTITVTNNGDTDLTGLEVIDILPDGMEYKGAERTSGFPQGDLVPEDQKSTDKASFAQSDKVIYKPTTFKGDIALDTLNFTATESFEVKSITLESRGIDLAKIEKVTLDGKEPIDYASNSFTFNFVDGDNCNALFDKNKSLALQVKLKEGGNENETFYFSVSNIQGSKSFEPGNESRKVKFIREKAEFIGTDQEVSVTVSSGVVDTLKFDVADSYQLTQFYLKKTGSLSGEHIKNILIGGKIVNKSNLNELTPGVISDIANGKEIPIVVEFSGMIQNGATLGFEVLTFSGNREIEGPKKTTSLITFIEKEEDRESVKFADGVEKKETWDVLTQKRLLDTLNFKINWDLNDTTLSFKNNGDLPTQNINKIFVGGKPATLSNDGIYKVEGISISKGKPTLDVEIEFTGDITSGAQLQLSLTEIQNGRNIGVGTTSKTITFDEIPEDASFVGGESSTKASNTGSITLDNLTFHINNPLTLKSITLEQTGKLSGNIEKITLSGVEMTPTDKIWKVQFADRQINSGDSLNLEIKFKGEANSGDTLGFKLIELNERRHIATGSETKVVHFEDNPEYVQFKARNDDTVENDNKVLHSYVSEANIDTLTFNLNKNLKVSHIALEKLGNVATGYISEVRLGNEELTRNPTTNLYEWNGNQNYVEMKNNDDLALKVKFSQKLPNNGILQFQLSELKDGRHIEMGSKTKTIMFNDDQSFTTSVEIGGTLHDETFSGNNKEVLVDTLQTYFNRLGDKAQVSLKKLILTNTGTLKNDQISSLSLKIGNATYQAEGKNGVFTFNFTDPIPTLTSGATMEIKAQIKEPKKGDILQFKISNFEIGEIGIATGVKKDTRVLAYETARITLKTENLTGTIRVNDISKTILLDNIIPEVTDGQSATIEKIELQLSGNLPKEYIKNVTLNGIEGTHTDTTPIIYTFVNKDKKLNVAQNKNIKFPLNITLQGDPDNETSLQFVLKNFQVKEEELMTGLAESIVTNTLVFNDPVLKIEVGDKFATLDKKHTSFGVFKLTADGFDATKENITTITLALTGTLPSNQITGFTLNINAGSYTSLCTQKERNITCNFSNYEIPATDFTVEADLTGENLDGKTLGFVIKNITMKNTEIKTSITDDTTDLVTYATPKISIEGSEGTITTKDTTLTLDNLKITTTNIEKPKIKTVELTLSGNITPTEVKLKEEKASIKDKIYTFNFENGLEVVNGTELPLIVTLPSSVENNQALQFIITKIDVDDPDVEKSISQPNTNTLTFNDPYLTISGFKGEKQIYGNDFTLSGFSVGYNGVTEANLQEITLLFSGITYENFKEGGTLNLVYPDPKDEMSTIAIQGIPTDDQKGFKFSSRDIQIDVINPGTEFMIEGHLTHTNTIKPSKFNFVVTGVKANINNENLRVEYYQDKDLSQTEVAVFNAQEIILKVHNEQDGEFETLTNRRLDRITFEFSGFEGVEKGTLRKITLIPQGDLSGALESVTIAGLSTDPTNGTYVWEHGMNFADITETGLNLNVTISQDKVKNGDTLWFVVNAFATSGSPTLEIKPDNHKTATITYKNPTIKLQGEGKENKEEKTEKSDFKLGNLTFTQDGISDVHLKAITLTLSGKNIKMGNLTGMKLTTEAEGLQMNGKIEGNTVQFTSKDAQSIKLDNNQEFVVVGSFTDEEIPDNAEIYFEVTDFVIEEEATKTATGTTKSITFINPTITLKGINNEQNGTVKDTIEANIIKVSLQKTNNPLIKTIILTQTGDIATGNIETLTIAGITGTYQKDNDYLFDFGDGVSITQDQELKLTITLTGSENDALKDKKIGFSIKEAKGNNKVTIENPETTVHTHGSATNSCYKGSLTNGYFKTIDKSGLPTILWKDFEGVLPVRHSIELKIKAKVTKSGTNKVEVIAPIPAQTEVSVKVKEKESLSCEINPGSISINFMNSNSLSQKVTCSTKNNVKAKIQIDCGNGQTSAWNNNVSKASYTCQYKASDFKNDEDLITKCTIMYDSDTATCQGSVGGSNSLGFCGDKQATDWEDCDCKGGYNSREKACNGDDIVYNKERGIDERNYQNVQCKNCKLEGATNIEPIMCWDANAGSISINQGEILPFYWNISKVDHHYKYSKKNISAQELYDNILGNSCSNENGDILLDSLLCTFKIFPGSNNEVESNDEGIYEFTVPCFNINKENERTETNKSLLEDEGIFSGWSAWLHNNNIVYGNNEGDSARTLNDATSYKFAPGVSYIKDFGNGMNKKKVFQYSQDQEVTEIEGKKEEIDTYGEYKLSLEEVTYIACVDGEWEKMDPYPRVCQNNFTVTKPYLITKTPSGIGSDVKDVLKKFYFMNGDTFDKKLTNLVDIDDDFGSEAFQATYTTFKNEYGALAKKAGDFGGLEASKVPSKEIYFVSGDMVISGYAIDYDISKSQGKEGAHTTIKTPITIVQTDGNTTIKGNIDHNIMLLSEGTITFDGTANCDDAQTVNGIFYAKNGFSRTGVHLNDNVENEERCIGGGLHIKGALIGSGIDDLVNKSRSQLNTWFFGKLENTITDRRNGIFNGAAVLIEYSPTLSANGTTPPGAEKFTSSINIYKR